MDVYHPNWSKRHQTDFQKLFESLPSAHLVVNADLRVIAVSDAYLRITENQRENLVGKQFDSHFSQTSDQPWIASVRKLIKSFHQVRRSSHRHAFIVRENVLDQEMLEGSSPRIWRAINTPFFDRNGKLNFIVHQLKKVNDPAASRLVRSFARRLISAQEKDRKRIARELHDQMAQYLSAISLELEAIKTNKCRETREHAVEHIQDLIEHVGDDVHRLTWDLRPAPIEDLGFRNSLFSCVEEVSSHSSLDVFFHSDLGVNDRFDPSIETICYRFVQEALANITKHASSTTASVIVTRKPSELELIVEDDGCGFDVVEFQKSGASRTHFGLQGMVERLKLVGGQLHIESAPGRGTSLFARVPTGEAGLS